MRLDEIKQTYKVIRHKDQKELFTGDRKACIEFIKGFDKGSDQYVDLRLVDLSGKEDNWHED
ncbi:MAG: hypothetical protein N2235_05325 [Fischerella sp.]|nr:hypothetical protein [Fischerella sp.]